MNQGSLFDKLISPTTLQLGKFTKHRGYLSVRVPVTMAAWLETMVVQKNSSDVDWHGRIPPLKDSIALRLSHLVVESLASKVYIQESAQDPRGVLDTNTCLWTDTYVVRLRLRTGFNTDRLLESAREFGRSISLETYYRCLDSLTLEESAQYKQFSEDYRKGNYVPKAPAIVKAIEKTKRKRAEEV